MKKTFRLLVLCLAAPFLAVSILMAEEQQAKAPDTVKKKEDFHIYLLIGSSNMTGKVLYPKLEKKLDPRIFVLSSANEWKSAEQIVKGQDKYEEIDSIGPGISFGRTMLSISRDDITIGTINCASAESDIKSWAKGSPLYTKAVERAKLAQKAGVLKGIIWHQGETDAKSMDFKAYSDATEKLISDLRGDLAPEQKIFPLPFVGGKLYSYPYDKDSDIFRDFNENLEKFYKDIERRGLVETKGLKVRGGSTLFDNESMIELGRRYADSMAYLYGNKK